MNILFDIFYKYKTPLNHEGSTCQQYLDNLLSDYICDIQKACYGSDERQLSNIIIDKVLSMVEGLVEFTADFQRQRKEQIGSIEDWFQKHPDRRKTERGMHAFVKAWLDSIIRGAAVSQYSTKRGRYHNAFNDVGLRQKYDFEELEADLLSISSGTDINESKQTLDHRGPK